MSVNVEAMGSLCGQETFEAPVAAAVSAPGILKDWKKHILFFSLFCSHGLYLKTCNPEIKRNSREFWQVLLWSLLSGGGPVITAPHHGNLWLLLWQGLLGLSVLPQNYPVPSQHDSEWYLCWWLCQWLLCWLSNILHWAASFPQWTQQWCAGRQKSSINFLFFLSKNFKFVSMFSLFLNKNNSFFIL